ncbi:hypothetical protein KBC31_00845 [Candidatus Saccharibacteria bacterium]|jgi:hypothetical protein|nr:hypothetical protein [Candidatus Saccharibacteria bacterium]
MWQDAILAIIAYLLSAALLPTIFSEQKPAFTTCLFNAILVIAATATLGSLGFWITFSGQALLSVGWIVLTFQTFPKH